MHGFFLLHEIFPSGPVMAVLLLGFLILLSASLGGVAVALVRWVPFGPRLGSRLVVLAVGALVLVEVTAIPHGDHILTLALDVGFAAAAVSAGVTALGAWPRAWRIGAVAYSGGFAGGWLIGGILNFLLGRSI
jgi:hypothetical protein